MDWNFSSEYFKKELYGEEYNCLKLSVVETEKVINSNLDNENNLEVQNTVPKETGSINLLIKKTSNGNVYILGDKTIIDVIVIIISNGNPMTAIMVNALFPLFKPLQLKLDIGNSKVLELFMGKKQIDVPDFGDLSFNDNELNKLCSMEIENPLIGNNNLIHDENDDENDDKNEYVDESTEEDSATDESEKSNDVNSDENEINSKFDELINKLGNCDTNELLKQLKGIDTNNLGNLLGGLGELGGLNTTEQNKFFEQTQPQFNISNLTNSIENIWNDKYYDDEKFDDFLMDDENKHEQEGKEVWKRVKKLGGLNTTEQNKFFEQTQPQFNISNLTNNIENIWNDKYYDDEKFDDFLMDDENKHEQEGKEVEERVGEEVGDENKEKYDSDDNLTRYLKLSPEEITMEICLVNLNDYSNVKENIKMLSSREMYNKKIKIFQSTNDENLSQIPQMPQFPKTVETKKWVGKDENGEPCLYYSFGNSKTRRFAYKHLAQLRKILLELVDTIQQM